MNWKRKSGTSTSNNGILTSSHNLLDDKKIKPGEFTKKSKKSEEYEDNYAIEFSDSDSNASYPLKKVKIMKKIDLPNKKIVSTFARNNAKQNIVTRKHNTYFEKGKTQKHETANLLQDSFNCFDDTQTLIKNGRQLKDTHLQTSKTNTYINKVCDKIKTSDNLLNTLSTSSKQTDRLQSNGKNIDNHSKSSSSKNISVPCKDKQLHSLNDFALPESQVKINSEFSDDDPFKLVLNKTDVLQQNFPEKDQKFFQFTQFFETTQFHNELDSVMLVKESPVSKISKENDVSSNSFQKNASNKNKNLPNECIAAEKIQLTNSLENGIKRYGKESSLDRDINSFLNNYIPNNCISNPKPLQSNYQVKHNKIDNELEAMDILSIKNKSTPKAQDSKNNDEKNILVVPCQSNLDTKNKNLPTSSDKLKLPIDFWDDTLNTAITQNFKSTQYKTDMETLFDKVETSILELGTNDTSIINTCNAKSDIVSILEKTFKSPEVLKKVLQTAEDSIKSSNQIIDWSDDTLLANAVINMSVEGQSIGDIIKKALIENVQRTSSPQKCVNKTIVDDEPGFKDFGPFYGLPHTVKDLMKLYKGIDSLYDWQNECLNLPAIKSRNNLVYALPTSGGKTLVAEILILKEVVCRKKNVLFVLPYVAIVQEKVWSLSPFAVSLEFLIEEFAAGKGTLPPRKRRRKNSVFIATIEKALSLMNSLIETGRTDEIGLIVVDELHLVGDRSRGSTLEELLTKVMLLKGNTQIIGMSATIGNISEISKFLNAEIYSKNFRPVELIEYVKCGNEIAKVDWTSGSQDDVLKFYRKLDYRYAESVAKIDPDRLGGLVMEVIPTDSCLIFCRSKQNCENVAVLLCKVIAGDLVKYKAKEKDRIKNALKDEAGSICDILKLSITYGVAYHHSGLTSEERRIIEEGFRQGVISVICCTSTLAAGVNLPAKRVIIRNPYIGRDFINLSRYKQMVGRAGRAGLGNYGESIIICTPEEVPKISQVLMSPMDIALSSMHCNEAKGLRHFLLSCISLKLATTKHELQMIARHTLMAIQSERLGVNIKKLTRSIITELFKMGAIQLEGQLPNSDSHNSNISVKLDNTSSFCSSADKSSPNINVSMLTRKTMVTVSNDSKLVISKMGKAAIKGGFDLGRAHMLYDDLLIAQASIVLLTGLHLMFLVTPYDLSEQIKPSMAQYYTLHSQLSLRESHTANVIGVTEAVASKMLSNKRIVEVPERVLNRFYVTLMLYDLWNEIPVYEVAAKYDINRGLIQNLMTSAATFASNVYNFCEVFEEFWAFSLLLKGMRDRLSHCCVKELIPLMTLPSVKQNRAKQLYNAGYKTLQSIAKADANDLVQAIEFMSRKLANQLIAASKLILLEKVENLREEAEDVLEGVDI